MLLRIRDGLQRQKWLGWVVLGLIGATFIFWGGANSLDFTGVSKTTAAEVDGIEIPASEATRAWSEQQARWSRQFGTDIPPEQREAMQQNILDGLVLRKLVDKRLDDAHYRVSNAMVFGEFHKIPDFKGPDGKFDVATARSVLAQNNKTEAEFFTETRSQMLVNQLQQGIGGSYFLTSGEKQRLFNLENEEREVQYAQLPADKFAGVEPIDDTAVKAFYDKNSDRFMTTESVELEYAELRLEQLAAQVVPTDAELQKLYDDNRASYVLDERRRARHIVISVTGDDDAAALKKAEGVAAEARAGKDFGELAKKYSADATAAQGGDLGFVLKRDFQGPIGDTLFSMKVGDVSAPVKSQFGYHILKLEQIQVGEAKPFADVRAELDSQYRQERATDLFSARQDDMSERLQKGVSDLDKLAQDLGLTRGFIPTFLRGGGAEPLGSSVDLQQTVFSDATLNQGKIGGPVGLGEDRMVLVKVKAHHKAEVKPLAVVHDEIVGLLKLERGVAAAKAAADAAVARLVAGEKLDELAKTLGIASEPARFMSRGDPSIPAALRTAIFEAPRPAATPVIKTATLDNGSTALFVVTRTRIADVGANPAITQQMNEQLQQRSAQGEIAAYVNEAKRKAKIVKNPAVFE
ncbi:MAG TPA: SurA N-terminal domain-containing protein [Steroidobacteraceae bacterium]|jgi:peptidyl-prolyl cis-trans isomerase D|nr:SurA N-terminal domain-containing protein [Steroidobacteraceae bacterium]